MPRPHIYPRTDCSSALPAKPQSRKTSWPTVSKQTVDMLSGGNIQKVVVARELSMPRDLIVIDQPSRGIDIGATKFIHEKIFELRDRDAAILISSADLAEIMELSDSLIVMYEGEIAAYFKSLQGITEETLGEYMLGIKKQTPEEIKEAFYE